MENTCKESISESSAIGVFELPGEPAVVINGVPDISPIDNAIVLSNTVNDAESPGDSGFGEWLEGREVRKLFGEEYYSGTVTQFDKETGWYRVEYEDGDFEDLDWHELEEVLLPLDITIPLKTLAMKVVKKNQKPILKSGRTKAQSRKHKAKSLGSKGDNVDSHEASGTQLNNS
ncbi:Dirigent protein 17-like [Melia azedarach]|uniref:Dirigent protein 17-like n=2 Tax=Melia azedarach TaxID=155640 RepID=A0ACC1X018_MELAZ|nr:Dirigent protein 17-like [Melia azedarach]KAJ4704796.1 Dirigent protein 17-like [Melia azedarach]